MSMSISISFFDAEPPRVEVIRIRSTGERFLSLYVDPRTSLTLDGYDATSVKHARQLAAVLMQAADKLEAEQAADPPPPAAPDPPAELPTPEPLADEEIL